ncbi:3415_t:CDS:2, partial [Dentiscutata erythropus]
MLVCLGQKELPSEDTPKRYAQLYFDCVDMDPKKRPDIISVLNSLESLIADYGQTIETIGQSCIIYARINKNQSPDVINLDQVRQMLNDEGTLNFDYFLSNENELIFREHEINTYLESILLKFTNENFYYFQVADVWMQLIKMSEHGFIFDNGHIKNAPRQAFEIIMDKIESKIFHKLCEQKKKVCRHELDVLCNRNLVSYGDISTIMPWLSIFLETTSPMQKLEYKKDEVIILIEKLEKAEVFISRENMNVTEDFKEQVKNALSCDNNDDKIEKLREITKEYGSFYARHIIFGGAIIEETITNNSSFVKPKVIGGDLNDDYSSKALEELLKDFKKWKIIGYDDVHLIFDILDGDLRREILNVLGYRILKANIKDISCDFSKKPYVYSLAEEFEKLSGKVLNIHDCHIFASIMNKQATDDAFSLRVEYIDNNPYIVVHLITSQSSQHKKRKIYPKIGWIIIGQPNYFDFDLAEYPVVLRSGKFPVSKLNNQYRAEFEFLKCDNTCLLSTCVFEASKLDEVSKTSIVVGTHISSNCSACLFVYDLKKNMIVDDDSLLQRLKLFICTIDMHNAAKKYNAGQIDIGKQMCETQPNAFNFPENKNRNEPVLVNLFSESCQNHGFLNVISDKVIYGGFNTKTLSSGKISYFFVPKKSNEA